MRSPEDSDEKGFSPNHDCLYRTAFEESSVPMAVVNREERIVAANGLFRERTGMGIGALLSLPATGERELPGTLPIAVIDEGGQQQLLSINKTDLGDGTMLAVLRDLQTRLATDEEAQSVFRAQRMEALGHMAAGIAHDFNNTLMSALPWADFLRKKFPSDETAVRATEHIRRAIFRAGEATRQLLDFAQPRKPQRRVIDLHIAVTSQLKMIRPAIPPEITMSLNNFVDSPMIEIDPAQFGQAILNIAINAREAMLQGGELRFDIRQPTAHESERWGIAADRNVVLDVGDTGRGIPPERVTRVFDPFFTTKELGGGTGLGLAVVHRVVEQNGGRIFLDSVVGRGTTVHLVFPRATEHSATDSTQRPQRSGEGRIVLIVDDEPSVAEGIAAILEMNGFSVYLASTGGEAIELLKKPLRPDFVVLDFGLPGMRGDQVHAAIRALNPTVPIIVSSGYGEDQRLLKLLDDPATRLKPKPYEVEDLIAELNSFS